MTAAPAFFLPPLGEMRVWHGICFHGSINQQEDIVMTEKIVLRGIHTAAFSNKDIWILEKEGNKEDYGKF